MRKHTILKLLLNTPSGLTPSEIASKLGIALPNCYTYLEQLEHENLIVRKDGKAYFDKSESKAELLLEIQSMAPDELDGLISPDFKEFLKRLAQNKKTTRAKLRKSDEYKLKKVALPKRIVLKISKKPAAYCLKLNEALVKTLLTYHGVRPNFSEADFNKVIGELGVKFSYVEKTAVASDPQVIKLCDEFYAKDGDLLISKLKNFKPDERISALLDASGRVNTEYSLYLRSLDGIVRDSVKQQWEQRYIYNTNRIEGNTMSEDQVGELLKEGKTPASASPREIFETTNLRRAIRFLDTKREEEPTLDLMREVHFLVQSEIKNDAGSFKAVYNYVRPNWPTTPPKHVKQRLEQLIRWYKENKGKMHPLLLASIFHMQFEIVHPFSDGNGRAGRLILNHILKQTGYMPVTIPVKTKDEYYRGIQNQSPQQFLLYLLTTFIQEYRRQ